MKSFILRLLAPEYSTCGKCKTPWKFTKGHMTEFRDGRSCFPLCEKCWSKLKTPEKRMPFYIELMDTWKADEKTRNEVYNAVKNGR